MASSNENHCKRCLMVSCAINVALIIAIIFILVLGGHFNDIDDLEDYEVNVQSSAIHQTNSSYDGGMSNSSVCLFCDYLGDTVNKNETLYEDIYRTSDQRKLCCFRNRVIHDFVRAVSETESRTIDGWRNCGFLNIHKLLGNILGLLKLRAFNLNINKYSW